MPLVIIATCQGRSEQKAGWQKCFRLVQTRAEWNIGGDSLCWHRQWGLHSEIDKMLKLRWTFVTQYAGSYTQRHTHLPLQVQIEADRQLELDWTGLVVIVRQGKTFPIWCYQPAALPSTHFLSKQHKRPGSLKYCLLLHYLKGAFFHIFLKSIKFCGRKHTG